MNVCTINGLKLAFADSGQGAPLLLVHGFPLDHSMWDGQIAGLSARHRVIAPDLRGFGQSGASEGVVTMEQFAADLVALLDSLGIDEVVYCGLSMGGYIGLEFWRRHADLLRGLIFCDTRAVGDSPAAAANRSVVAANVLREGPQTVAEAMLPKLFGPVTFKQRPDVVEKIERVINGNSRQGIAAAALGMARRSDFSVDLPNIRCPTLLIVGENDAISPAAEMQAMANAIPGAELKIIPQAGHMSPLEQPAAVNAEIELFLEQKQL
jgi:3-oxoadipate enol-lactonase